jgi:hypothetical protein
MTSPFDESGFLLNVWLHHFCVVCAIPIMPRQTTSPIWMADQLTTILRLKDLSVRHLMMAINYSGRQLSRGIDSTGKTPSGERSPQGRK